MAQGDGCPPESFAFLGVPSALAVQGAVVVALGLQGAQQLGHGGTVGAAYAALQVVEDVDGTEEVGLRAGRGLVVGLEQ